MIAEGEDKCTAGSDTGTDERTEPVFCDFRGAANDGRARFCNQCSGRIVTVKTCGQCHVKNYGDAKFCDNCGGRLV